MARFSLWIRVDGPPAHARSGSLSRDARSFQRPQSRPRIRGRPSSTRGIRSTTERERHRGGGRPFRILRRRTLLGVHRQRWRRVALHPGGRAGSRPVSRPDTGRHRAGHRAIRGDVAPVISPPHVAERKPAACGPTRNDERLKPQPVDASHGREAGITPEVPLERGIPGETLGDAHHLLAEQA
jgi:hypothetical protein